MTASVESVFNETYNCDKCLSSRGMTQANRKYKGCFGNTPIKYTLENIIFRSCPGNYTTPYLYNLLDLYGAYERNMGLSECLNMTYKYFQIFGIISNIKEKYRKKEEQRGKRNKSRNNR